jgi:hypothetical protein
VEDGRGNMTEWMGEMQPEGWRAGQRWWRYAGEGGDAPVVQGWRWEGRIVLVEGMSVSGLGREKKRRQPSEYFVYMQEL